ncbi:hypothetical protein N7504_000395 [Penicillium tannophilum]|nr:hypothetical protein N7504_000395 [Penicillium tannophilum]
MSLLPRAHSNTSASVGIIREIATKPTNLTGRSVVASDEEPRYQLTGLQIENEKTRKSSAVKEANIIGPAE